MRTPYTLAGLLVCVVGAAAVFLPWATATELLTDPTPGPDGVYKARALPRTLSVTGTELWAARGAALAFVAGALFLVVVSPIRPPAAARPVGLIVWGGLAIGSVLAAMDADAPALRTDPPAGRHVTLPSWQVGMYVAGAAALGLGVVAALELRSWVAGHAAPGTSKTA